MDDDSGSETTPPPRPPPTRKKTRKELAAAAIAKEEKAAAAKKKRSSSSNNGSGGDLACLEHLHARRKKARVNRNNNNNPSVFPDAALSSSSAASKRYKSITSSASKAKKTVAITPLALLNNNNNDSTSSIDEDDNNTDESKRCLSRELLLATINLPPKVPDLFNFPKHQPTPCQCHHHMTSTKSVCVGRCDTVAHLHEYGWEYKSLLSNMEELEYERRDQLPPWGGTYCPDPMRLLALSDIVRPPDVRRRHEHEMASWRSTWTMEWTLEEYMDRQPDMEARMRGILIDWIIELSEEYKFSPMTLHLAITLIDKSLACTPTGTEDVDGRPVAGPRMSIPRDLLQCLGCACTWIAAKLEESNPPSAEDFVYISDNIYQKDQILEMEVEVCAALKFRLQHVTPVHFAHEYLLASQGGPCRPNAPTGPVFHCLLRNMVHYLLELSRISYELLHIKPSLMAAAAVFLARATLGIRNESIDESSGVEGEEMEHKFWSKTLQCYTGYSAEDLKETVLILHGYHRRAESSNLKAVFNKYGRSKFMHVAHKTVLQIEDLEFDLEFDD